MRSVLAALLLVGACGRPAAPPPFTYLTLPYNAAMGAEPDGVGIVLLGRIKVHEPFLVRAARPLSLRPGTNLVAARAMFVGSDPSPSGHFAQNGFILSSCSKLPITGYGWTYDAAGLRLAVGDEVAFVAYLTAPEVGARGFDGVQIEYERHGRRGVFKKAGSTFSMHIRKPGMTPVPQAGEVGQCNPLSGRGHTRPPGGPLRSPHTPDGLPSR